MKQHSFGGRQRRKPVSRRTRLHAMPALAVLAGSLCAAPAQARMPAFALQAAPQVHWSEPVSARVWGMPLHYVRFATSWPLERMAAELSSDVARFQLFTQLPGRLMLSGQVSGQHWVAQLAAHGQGSRGMVSVWQVPEAVGAAPDGKSALTELFQSSTLWRTLLHVCQEQDGHMVEHAVYHAMVSLPVLLDDVERRLRQAGWEPDQQDNGKEQTWRRSGQRLRWRHHAQPGQAMVFMHYTE